MRDFTQDRNAWREAQGYTDAQCCVLDSLGLTSWDEVERRFAGKSPAEIQATANRKRWPDEALGLEDAQVVHDTIRETPWSL